ncbi:dehydrogenase [Enterococcus florum]|uniref:Dehydrogenase n=1 Tax=Enterococcus florum TaxID=2480627 RepID=A0A4P5PFL9_9ENTE|nr:Gfo/Idh/MocA family oxidoreductase [Enterococcus florum]GCF94432.1 dehydrogenase [Enterococcus florum]
MKIGVIGLGSIAQKAYLPIYAKMQDQAEFIFSTRNEEVRDKVSQKYRFQNIVASFDELMEYRLDACFIHAATDSHYELAKRCLQNNIHVFIDKPVSESYKETKELFELAEEKDLLFMVGFNRRFAPMVEKLKSLPEKRTIHLEKNEVDQALSTQYGIYDMFIHLIDTAVYLLDDPILNVHSKVREQAGKMTYAQMQISTEQTECMLTMDLQSGAKTECYQITTPEKSLILDQLTDLTVKINDQTKTMRFGAWANTLEKRGFEQMVAAFLSSLKRRSKESLRQKDVLLSHKLCRGMLIDHVRSML